MLTAKRLELLRYVRRHEVASVRAFAKALARDYHSVHADVEALTAADFSTLPKAAYAPTTMRLKPKSILSEAPAEGLFRSAHRDDVEKILAWTHLLILLCRLCRFRFSAANLGFDQSSAYASWPAFRPHGMECALQRS